MQAPCSLNALAWGVMRRDGTSAALLLGTPDLRVADRLTHALFGMATAVLWLTLLALWRRRAAIRTQGFAPNFTALTFPSCSSAVAALQYAADPRADAAAPRGLARGARGALQVYAVALALLTLAVVLLVLVGFVLHVARHGGVGDSSDGDPARRRRGAAEEGVLQAECGGVRPAMVEMPPCDRQTDWLTVSMPVI